MTTTPAVTTARVYQYGVASRLRDAAGNRARVDLPDWAMAQLRAAHDLRNRLVRLEHDHADHVAAVWSTRPEIAALDAELAAKDDQVDTAAKAVKDWKRNNPSKRPPATVTGPLRIAKATRKTVKAAHRSAKDVAYDALADQFHRLNDAKKAATKDLYREMVSNGDLGWATFNSVTAHHRTAMARIATDRKRGRPADIRFQRWRGEGTLTVQLQRGKDHPQRTPRLLASGPNTPERLCGGKVGGRPEYGRKTPLGPRRSDRPIGVSTELRFLTPFAEQCQPPNRRSCAVAHSRGTSGQRGQRGI